jgi:hypothetical protein
VNHQFRARGGLELPVGAHVIEMAMGVDDAFDPEMGLFYFRQNTVRVVARIDDGARKGRFASDNKTIGLNRTNSDTFYDQKSLLMTCFPVRLS